MDKTLSYPLRVEHHVEDGGYLAFFPDLPGCQTWGVTFEAAVANAEEALALYLETLVANGDPVPEVSQIDRSTSLGVIVRSPVAA
jgi:predicted RNase H-like HicB family nuclease